MPHSSLPLSRPWRRLLHVPTLGGALLALGACDAGRGGARPAGAPATVASAAADTGRAAPTPAPAPADTVSAESAGTLATGDTTPAAKPVRGSVTRSARVDSLWAARYKAPVAAGSILPQKRIVAFYGNPLSKRMGVLGEYAQPEMLAKLDREVANWNRADPSTPVQPALHLIATVAQGDAGKDGMYRYRIHPELIEKVYGWAKSKNALLFLDIQIGKSSIEEELQVLLPYLQRPDVHLGIDPEFAMTKGGLPGRRVGTYDATHLNYVIRTLGDLVTRHRLPPKVFVVHRFTGPMVTNVMDVKLDPRVQVVMHMDGWGPPYGKRATWSRFIYPHPVQYTGFKLFYHNDTKAGHPLMKPADVLALYPKPLYIQYQ